MDKAGVRGAGAPPGRLGDEPSSGSFRTPVENYRGGLPSSGNMPASAKLTPAPEPFNSQLPRCRCLVRVLCSPGSDSLESTHRFLSSYAQSRFRAQIAQRISVAGYELLSNALNYSSMADEVTIELMDQPDFAAVRVANETITPRISMLSEHVAKIRANAEATLVDEMRRSVAGGPVRPMLGLARVVHEVSMQLDVVVAERRVTMTASCRK